MSLKTPLNISYWWNLGSLLGLLMVIQIVSGLLLTFYYEAGISAFLSLQKLCLEVKFSFFLQALHLNCSTLIFLVMYLHLLKGLIFCSFHNKFMWISGLFLLILVMAISFLGYVLPWGQMSLWGATVITNLLSVLPMVGPALVTWLWAGFFISEYTLKLFFTLHFILPMSSLLLVLVHLVILHIQGSSNPLGGQLELKTEFTSYFVYKDMLNLLLMLLSLLILLYLPFWVGDSENYVECNPMSSPLHIQPEWYFLNYYCILRSVPSKSGGVIMFVLSLVCLFTLSHTNNSNLKSWYHWKFWWLWCSVFTSINMLLIWLGSCPVESPFLKMSQVVSTLYFSWFSLFLVVTLFY